MSRVPPALPPQRTPRPRRGRAKNKIQIKSLSSDELDGALSGDEVVVNHAADGDHGEAAVLDLGKLHACLGIALGEACRVVASSDFDQVSDVRFRAGSGGERVENAVVRGRRGRVYTPRGSKP